MDQTHNKRKYILTMHAKERYRERVATDGANKSNVAALKWVTRALNNGHLASENKDGTTTYRYQKYLIVMSNNTVITISYHNDQDVKPLKEDIASMIRKRLRKEIKVLVTQRKNLMIKSHELNIEKLKATTRTKQLRSEVEVDGLQKECQSLRSQIKAIIDVGNRHGINKEDIVLDSDLI